MFGLFVELLHILLIVVDIALMKKNTNSGNNHLSFDDTFLFPISLLFYSMNTITAALSPCMVI